ncbi:MAG: hypothetical protein ACI8ZA_002442 [Gammaproteobacteria bacterium]|jgi:hypothetical protein
MKEGNALVAHFHDKCNDVRRSYAAYNSLKWGITWGQCNKGTLTKRGLRMLAPRMNFIYSVLFSNNKP